MGIVEALGMLVQGFKLIGDGTAALIETALASLGFSVPDWTIRLTMLLATAVAAWKFAGVLPKLVNAALAIFFVSTALGLPTSSLPK